MVWSHKTKCSACFPAQPPPVSSHIRHGAAVDDSDDTDLLKSDFKADYRSCPIKEEHLDLARIAVWDSVFETYLESQHFATPFGAISAVHAWDRLGECLKAILSRSMTVPICRHVDDLFMATYRSGAAELRNFLLEIIDLLGFTFSLERKPHIHYQNRRYWVST